MHKLRHTFQSASAGTEFSIAPTLLHERKYINSAACPPLLIQLLLLHRWDDDCYDTLNISYIIH